MMGEQRDRAYGKGARMLLANLAACRDVVIWAIDLRPGAELRPRAPRPGRLATTPAQAAALPAGAVTIVFARAGTSPATANASGNHHPPGRPW